MQDDRKRSDIWFKGKVLSELSNSELKRFRKELRSQNIGTNKEIKDLTFRFEKDKGQELEYIALNYTHKNFCKTPEWRSIRYRALKSMGNLCTQCGASPRTGAVVHVDHIKPRSLYPELAFDMSNLQILCEDCNLGKSNKDDTNFKVILRKGG